MASALASQLGALRSLNAQRLTTSAQARQSHAPVSYLFSSRDASRQDLRTVHAVALNGWEELCARDPSVAAWASANGEGEGHSRAAVERLLAESSLNTDRTMLGKEDNAEIDACIELLLRRLDAQLLERSVSKIIEWLVRRFR